jgi:hypothetical protein
MSQLIKALQILLKYGNPDFPTHCEHDALYIMINPDNVSAEDKIQLEILGVLVNEYDECFISYKYGSA